MPACEWCWRHAGSAERYEHVLREQSQLGQAALCPEARRIAAYHGYPACSSCGVVDADHRCPGYFEEA
jgi:hypothetical protein